MKKVKMGCLGILAIFVLLAAVGSLMGKSGSDTPAGSSTTSNSKVAEKKAPEYTCEVEGVGKIKGAIASDVGIAVYGIDETGVLGNQYHQEQAQGKFVIVSVVINNGQKDAITVDANSFKLVTKDGIEYSHSTEAQTALALENNGKMDSFLKQINPGMTVSAKIPFDIPKDKNISDLQLEARGGFSGQKMLLPLIVQKAE